MKWLTLIAGLLAIVLIALTGPVYKAELLGFRDIMSMMKFATYAGFATIALALIHVIFMRKNISWAVTGLSVLCAVIAISIPMSMKSKGGSVPAIHDITTDLVNPPKFDAILALRANAPNPAAYQGKEIASQQREAYPEIQTQKYQQSAEQVFDAAIASLNAMGIDVVDSDKTAGRIEASDITPWFGFIDDVVIRIQTAGDITLLDVRSKSRLGRSDLGKNAQRISNIISGIESKLI